MIVVFRFGSCFVLFVGWLFDFPFKVRKQTWRNTTEYLSSLLFSVWGTESRPSLTEGSTDLSCFKWVITKSLSWTDLFLNTVTSSVNCCSTLHMMHGRCSFQGLGPIHRDTVNLLWKHCLGFFFFFNLPARDQLKIKKQNKTKKISKLKGLNLKQRKLLLETKNYNLTLCSLERKQMAFPGVMWCMACHSFVTFLYKSCAFSCISHLQVLRSVLNISSLCFTGSFWFLSFGYNYILQFQMIPIMTFRERARDVKMGPS